MSAEVANWDAQIVARAKFEFRLQFEKTLRAGYFGQGKIQSLKAHKLINLFW